MKSLKAETIIMRSSSNEDSDDVNDWRDSESYVSDKKAWDERDADLHGNCVCVALLQRFDLFR